MPGEAHLITIYRIRDPAWIAVKHLSPVGGRWVQKGNEIRFWNVEEQVADTVIKRMLNCCYGAPKTSQPGALENQPL
jgi:hypothetical protein